MMRIEISVKYDHIKGATKNKALGWSARGMYSPQAVKVVKNDLHTLIRGEINAANGGVKFQDAKVWVRIMDYRPRHPDDPVADVDPINFLDIVGDAVESAIGVDDKWFSANIDWGVDVDNPRVEITIEQGG